MKKLISEVDVDKVVREGQKVIEFSENTIITPLAYDLIRKYGLRTSAENDLKKDRGTGRSDERRPETEGISREEIKAAIVTRLAKSKFPFDVNELDLIVDKVLDKILVK